MQNHYEPEMLKKEHGYALGKFALKLEIVPGKFFPYFGSSCYGPIFADEIGFTSSGIEDVVRDFIKYWLDNNEVTHHSQGQIQGTIFQLGAQLERRGTEHIQVARGEKIFEVEIGFTKCVLQFGRLGNTLGFNIRHQDKSKPMPKTAKVVLDCFINDSTSAVTPYVETFIFKTDFSIFEFLPSLKETNEICSKNIDELISILSVNWGHVNWAKNKEEVFDDLINQYENQDAPKAIIGDCQGFLISVNLIHTNDNVDRNDKIWRDGNLVMSETEDNPTFSFCHSDDLCLQFEFDSGLDQRDKVNDMNVKNTQNMFKKHASLLNAGLLSMCKLRSMQEYDM